MLRPDLPYITDALVEQLRERFPDTVPTEDEDVTIANVNRIRGHRDVIDYIIDLQVLQNSKE